MESLENMNINIDDIPLEPVTHILFFMKNGLQAGIETPLAVGDFAQIWNTRKRRIKIITGNRSYAYVDKKCVEFYHASPIVKD